VDVVFRDQVHGVLGVAQGEVEHLLLLRAQDLVELVWGVAAVAGEGVLALVHQQPRLQRVAAAGGSAEATAVCHPHAAVGVDAVAVVLACDLPALVVQRPELLALGDDDLGPGRRGEGREQKPGGGQSDEAAGRGGALRVTRTAWVGTGG
jgi:hypothetical protein